LAAFSADFVTAGKDDQQCPHKGHYLLTLASSLLGFVDGLDDTNSNSLSHVTNGKTTKRRILGIGLDTLYARCKEKVPE
jgi:hypothetical protein